MRRWTAALILTAALVFLSASATLSGRLASDDDAIHCTIEQHYSNYIQENAAINPVDDETEPFNCKP